LFFKGSITVFLDANHVILNKHKPAKKRKAQNSAKYFAEDIEPNL